MKIFTQEPDMEQHLITALKEGGQIAFEDFYDQYAPSFFGEIKRTLYNEDVSEQTLKQAFKNIWISISTYDSSKERLFTWAIKIARKEIRKQKTGLVLKELFYCQQSNRVIEANQDKGLP